VTLEALAGHAVGPAAFTVEAGAVAEFAAVSGDDPGRWRECAPPGFAAAALFAVAPAFLEDPRVAPYSRSLLHAEQAFTWKRPVAVGEALEVRGRVVAVRSRGSLHLVSFEVGAAGAAGVWMEGVSSFLLSAEAADDCAEEAEPALDERAPCDPLPLAPLPLPGEALPPLRRSVSRADLVRYAAATGDDNAIHTDHAAARAAGLPGVIAHGLLLAAWFCQAAARFRPGQHPVQSARVRFRRPLRPGIAATVTGRVAAVGAAGADLEMALGAAGDGAPLATATVRVTP
jgi:acyl dehydratase